MEFDGFHYHDTGEGYGKKTIPGPAAVLDSSEPSLLAWLVLSWDSGRFLLVQLERCSKGISQHQGSLSTPEKGRTVSCFD